MIIHKIVFHDKINDKYGYVSGIGIEYSPDSACICECHKKIISIEEIKKDIAVLDFVKSLRLLADYCENNMNIPAQCIVEKK